MASKSYFSIIVLSSSLWMKAKITNKYNVSASTFLLKG